MPGRHSDGTEARATLTRSVLLPSAMQLLGRANWYLPRRLEWLPRLRVEGPGAAPSRSPVAGSGA